MSIMVTGAAGFIGYHLSQALLARGDRVVGVDSLNAYYDPKLKHARLDRLARHDNFTFNQVELSDRAAMETLGARHTDVTHIVNLAAQAGVRHSLLHPRDYIQANLSGFLEVLELARHMPKTPNLVYASSSSVYGANTKLPFAVEDAADRPLALYGATKKANEAMAYSYAHLYRIPSIGFRFFTVYGPWGRPDMSAYIFTRAILAGEEITVNNNGDMRRDFTFVDDIVAGLVASLDHPPAPGADGSAPHRVYNLGNHKSEPLMRFIEILETACGKKAKIKFAPMQDGDVKDTYADIAASTRDLGFMPRVSIDEGLPRFVDWYKSYHKA
ncbi:MAG TPA: NAD-dependent epimerase/dehydratase family protein [Magnetospirillaceae bacterium]|jgi:UDP-glucuronate 4-epimerase